MAEVSKSFCNKCQAIVTTKKNICPFCRENLQPLTDENDPFKVGFNQEKMTSIPKYPKMSNVEEFLVVLLTTDIGCMIAIVPVVALGYLLYFLFKKHLLHWLIVGIVFLIVFFKCKALFNDKSN